MAPQEVAKTPSGYRLIDLFCGCGGMTLGFKIKTTGKENE